MEGTDMSKQMTEPEILKATMMKKMFKMVTIQKDAINSHIKTCKSHNHGFGRSQTLKSKQRLTEKSQNVRNKSIVR